MPIKSYFPCGVQLLAALAAIALGELTTVADIPVRRATLFGFELCGSGELLEVEAAAHAIRRELAHLAHSAVATARAEAAAPTPTHLEASVAAVEAAPAPEPPPPPVARRASSSTTPEAAALEAPIHEALATVATQGRWTISHHPLEDGTPRIALRFLPAVWSLGSLRQGVYEAMIALAPYRPDLSDGRVWITLRTAEAAQAPRAA
jgi:hypothetical protein